VSKVQQGQSWSFVCHLNYGNTGAVSIVSYDGKQTKNLAVADGNDSGRDMPHKPVFLGMDRENNVILLDPDNRQIQLQPRFPIDAIAAYAYRDSDNDRIWFMNDGDKETGNDILNCGDKGASVTVIENTDGSAPPGLLKTICVGRGHHVTTFTSPSSTAPDMPGQAFVSNLMDGTISVIGNDPGHKDSFLKVMDTINLCEPDREDNGQMSVPNNAFPHGMVFSHVTGKLYNLNNGYKTIAVIDPVRNVIEDTIELKASSNLLLSPDGRFIIGKGVDRKSDQDHVIGKISVIDARAKKICEVIDLPDIYPSTYRFNADGTKLYVTTASTGKGKQKENVRIDAVLLFDTSKLPQITLLKEIQVGIADCGRRPIAFLESNDKTVLVFVPNPTDSTITVLSGADESVVDTVTVGNGPITELSFSFWDGGITGC